MARERRLGGLVRRPLLEVMRALGLLRLWRWSHRDAVVILTVHGVVDESAPSGSWQPLRPRMPIARLEECLTLLGEAYTFVPLDEAVDMLSGRRPVVSNAMVLTFDDGYRTQVSAVAALLQRLGVPATVFVATGPVTSRAPFWFDRLDFVLQHVRGTREVVVGGQSLTVDAASRDRLAEDYGRLRELAKRADRDDREMHRELDELASRLERETGARLATIFEGDPWSAILSAGEIQQAAAPIGFGSHTVDHLRIHLLDRETALAQLARSKADLERWTGRPCRVFCYPNGGVSPAAADLVRACGYAAAVTTERGVNRVGGDPMYLRRVDLPASGSAAEVLAAVSGFTDRLLALRDWIRRA